MAGYVNIGGVWKEASALHANVGGVQKEITQGYTNIGGVWKPIFDSIPRTTNFADNSVFDYYSGGDVSDQSYASRNGNSIYARCCYLILGGSIQCLLTTKSPIDFSRIQSVSVTGNHIDKTTGRDFENRAYLYLCAQKPTSYTPSVINYSTYFYHSDEKGTYPFSLEIDTSAVTGKFYVAVKIHLRRTRESIGGGVDETWIYAPITFS